MFTGIVQASLPLHSVHDKPGLRRLGVRLGALGEGLGRGASVAIDGVCLTATDQDEGVVYFDVMQETLSKTTLGRLSSGELVHVERSARVGDEIGGHRVSGHVNLCAEVVAITTPEHNVVLTLKVPGRALPYLFEKGFVGVKGASLTVVNLNAGAGTFEVWLIPETLRVTTFGGLNLGDQVNLELDPQTVAIVDTVHRVLKHHPALGALFLEEGSKPASP